MKKILKKIYVFTLCGLMGLLFAGCGNKTTVVEDKVEEPMVTESNVDDNSAAGSLGDKREDEEFHGNVLIVDDHNLYVMDADDVEKGNDAKSYVLTYLRGHVDELKLDVNEKSIDEIADFIVSSLKFVGVKFPYSIDMKYIEKIESSSSTDDSLRTGSFPRDYLCGDVPYPEHYSIVIKDSDVVIYEGEFDFEFTKIIWNSRIDSKGAKSVWNEIDDVWKSVGVTSANIDVQLPLYMSMRYAPKSMCDDKLVKVIKQCAKEHNFENYEVVCYGVNKVIYDETKVNGVTCLDIKDLIYRFFIRDPKGSRPGLPDTSGNCFDLFINQNVEVINDDVYFENIKKNSSAFDDFMNKLGWQDGDGRIVFYGVAPVYDDDGNIVDLIYRYEIFNDSIDTTKVYESYDEYSISDFISNCYDLYINKNGDIVRSQYWVYGEPVRFTWDPIYSVTFLYHESEFNDYVKEFMTDNSKDGVLDPRLMFSKHIFENLDKDDYFNDVIYQHIYYYAHGSEYVYMTGDGKIFYEFERENPSFKAKGAVKETYVCTLTKTEMDHFIKLIDEDEKAKYFIDLGITKFQDMLPASKAPVGVSNIRN